MYFHEYLICSIKKLWKERLIKKWSLISFIKSANWKDLAFFDLNVSQEWLSISKLHKLLADHKLDKESNPGEAIIAKRKKGPPKKIAPKIRCSIIENLHTYIQNLEQILPYALMVILKSLGNIHVFNHFCHFIHLHLLCRNHKSHLGYHLIMTGN